MFQLNHFTLNYLTNSRHRINPENKLVISQFCCQNSRETARESNYSLSKEGFIMRLIEPAPACHRLAQDTASILAYVAMAGRCHSSYQIG